MMRKLFPTILAIALAGCTNSSLLGGSNKPSGDGKRPTEGGEGVPGYLTDPDLVSVDRDEDIRVTGAPGAVTAGDTTLDFLKVCLYAQGDDDRLPLNEAGVNEDGSFSLKAATDNPQSLVSLRVGVDCSDAEFNGGGDELVEQEGGGFIVFEGPEDQAGIEEDYQSEVSFCQDDGSCQSLVVKISGINGDEELGSSVRFNRVSDCKAHDIAIKTSGGCPDGQGADFTFVRGSDESLVTDFKYGECVSIDHPLLIAGIDDRAKSDCAATPYGLAGSLSSVVTIKIPADEGGTFTFESGTGLSDKLSVSTTDLNVDMVEYQITLK